MNPYAPVAFWLYALMEVWNPAKYRNKTFITEAQESQAQAVERYIGIAQAAIDVAFDPKEPPVFVSKNEEKARMHTALLILSVAYLESGMRRDVDFGQGKYSRGDGGRSWCMMQINVGSGTVPDPDPVISTWTGKDLVSDRTKCFRVGLHRIRRSFAACAANPLKYRLAAYASGSCERGHDESAARMLFWSRQLKRLTPTPPKKEENHDNVFGSARARE